MTDNKRDSDEEKHTHYHFLPDELWEIILSKLTLKDNIRASAVSKRFLSIATLVQKIDKPPLLMLDPRYCDPDSYRFIDPFNNHKPYRLDLPELRRTRFHHSKDGWLLVEKYHSSSAFFFRPHTRELIQLPKVSYKVSAYIFSSAPTTPNCTVFAVDRYAKGTINISTCRPGDTKWTDFNYQTTFGRTYWDNIILCKGLLYCFNDYGSTAIYDPKESSCKDIRIPIGYKCRGAWIKFLGEYNGDIINVFLFRHYRSSVILKLDLTKKTWVKMETLGGNTLFLGSLHSYPRTWTSDVRTNFIGNKRNNVYVSMVDLDENGFSYSFKEGKLLPNDHHGYKDPIDVREGIWIDAPEDLSN